MSRVMRDQCRRVTGGHAIKMHDGKLENIYTARIVYKCIHCLNDLEIKGFGLTCKSNQNHYGFINRDEAAKLTTQERFMKIGEMFPSEYLRGIDVVKPQKMKIIKVVGEQVRSRDNNKMEPEFVLYFEGETRKLRLNWTMAKEVHVEILKLGPDDDVEEKWPGNYVTVYQTTVKAFGKEHIVPRIRKPEQGDAIFPPLGEEKALNTLSRKEFWSRVKRDLALPTEVSKFVLIQADLSGEYKQENAPKMWKVLEQDGQKLDYFLQLVMTDTPYFENKESILALMDEWNTGYEFSEAFEMEMSARLEDYAKGMADTDNDEGNSPIQEDELPF